MKFYIIIQLIREMHKSIGNRWRALSVKEVNAIEEEYQRYIRELQIGKMDADYQIILAQNKKNDSKLIVKQKV